MIRKEVTMAITKAINSGERGTGYIVDNSDIDSISTLTVQGVLYGREADGEQNLVQAGGTIEVIDGGEAYDIRISEDGTLRVSNGYASDISSTQFTIASNQDYQLKVFVAGTGVVENITLMGAVEVDLNGYVTKSTNALLEVDGEASLSNGDFTYTTVRVKGGVMSDSVVRSGSELEISAGAVASNINLYHGATLTYTIGAGSKLSATLLTRTINADGEVEDIVLGKLSYGAAISGKTIDGAVDGVQQKFVLEAGGSISNMKLKSETSLVANAGRISNLSIGTNTVDPASNAQATIAGADVKANGINVYRAGNLLVTNGTVNNVNVQGGQATFTGGTVNKVTAVGLVVNHKDGSGVVAGNVKINISGDAVMNNITVKDGAELYQDGGSVSNVTIFARAISNFSGGVEYTLRGGTAEKVTLKTGNAGNYEDAIASLVVGGSGSVTSATLNAKTEMIVGGAKATAAETSVKKGGKMYVRNNAMVRDTQVKTGGILNVEDTAMESGAVVANGGTMVIKGGAKSEMAEIKNGGIMTVEAGGVARNTDIDKGGKMDVRLTAGTYWAGTSGGVAFEYGTLNSATGMAGKMNVSAFTATATRKGTVYKAQVDNVLVDKKGEFLVNEDAKLNNVAVNANGTLVVNGGNVAAALSGAGNASTELTDVRIYKNGKIDFTAGLVNTTNGAITTQRAYATAVGTSNYVGFSYGAILENVTADKYRNFTVTQNGIARNMTVANGGKLTVTAAVVGTESGTSNGKDYVNNIYEGGVVDGLTVNKGAVVYVYGGAKLTGDIVLNSKINAVNAELNFNLVGKDLFNDDWCVTNFSNLNGSGMTYTLDLAFNQDAGEYKLANKAQNFNGVVRFVTNATSAGSSTANTYHDLELGVRYYHEEANRYLTLEKVDGNLMLKVEYDQENPNHNLALAELDDAGDRLFVGVGDTLTGDTRVFNSQKVNVAFKIENDTFADYKQADFVAKWELTITNQLTGKVEKTMTFDISDLDAGKTTNEYTLSTGDRVALKAGVYDVTLTLKNNFAVYDTIRETITVMNENDDLYFNTEFDTIDRYQKNGDASFAEAYAGGNEVRTILLGELSAGIYSFGSMTFDEDFSGTVKLLNEDLKTVINVSVKNGVANLAGAVLEAGSYAIQIQGANATDYEFQLVRGEGFKNYSGAIVNNETWVDAHHYAKEVVKVDAPILDNLTLKTTIGADGGNGDILLKIGDTVAVKAIEFVGNEAGQNRYTFGVSGLGGDDAIKFSLVSVTDGTKVKTVKTVTLNADGTLGDAMQIKPADNVEYYLIAENLNANKGVESDLQLWVDTDATLVKKANNADDVMVGATNVYAEAPAPAPTVNGAYITAFEDVITVSDWVGSTDTADWFVLNINNESLGFWEKVDPETGNTVQIPLNVGISGEYSFMISSELEKGVKMTVYRAYDDNKGYGASVNGVTSALVQVSSVTAGVTAKPVDLQAGTYYIKVENTNSKNYLKDTDYSFGVSLLDQRKELFTLNGKTDSLAMNTVDEYYFELTDYTDVTFSSVTGMTLFQDNGKNGMTKITVKAKETITLAAGTYYIDTTAKCDSIGIRLDNSKYEHGVVNNHNDSWKTAEEIELVDSKFSTNDPATDIAADDGSVTVTPDAWVGYGNTADYYKLNVTGATAGKYTLSLSDAEFGNVKLTVYRVQADKNGVESLVKMSGINYSVSAQKIVINDLLDGSYYVAVETTKAGTALTSKNSDYTLDVEVAAYAQLDKKTVDETAGTETLVGDKIAAGSYGTFTLTEKSLVTLVSDAKISGATIYYNNGQNGFQAVAVTDNKAVLEAGTYYVKANSKEAIKAESIVITDEVTDLALEFSGMDLATGARKLSYNENGMDITTGINGWVGLNAAEDAFILSTDADNAYGWMNLSLTVNDAETLMAAKTSVTFSVYQNTGTDEKPVWKLVTSAKYNAGDKKNTITLDFDIRNQADYKFVVTTSDKGKGTCNVDYTITGDLYNGKLTGKDIGTVATALTEGSDTLYDMSAGVKNGYAVLVVENLSHLNLKSGYTLYSANAAGNLTAVKLYGKKGTEAVIGTGVYYIAGSNGDKQLGTIEDITANVDMEQITFDAGSAAANKSALNPDNADAAGTGINGWVGVTNASDDFLFNTYSDGTAAAGWVDFELSSLTDQFGNGAKVSMTLYKNVNGVWKKVSGITTTSGTKLSGNVLGASLDENSEYKLSIESGDKGKGSANLSYELDGTLDYYDLDNNSILTATRLGMSESEDTDADENTVTNVWDATVTKAGDKVDFYDVNDLDNLKLTVEKGASVKVTWYDENFKAVKANGASLTVTGSAAILSDSTAFDEVRYVKIEAVGSANNHYTLTSTVTKA